VEIEAKFRVPDEDTLHRLAEAGELAGLPLSTGTVKDVSDTYLDTSQRLVLSAGYFCRRRVSKGRILITLKQLGGAQGVVHRREEYEVELSEDLPPAGWPDSPARTRVLEIIGDDPLAEVLTLRQTRTTRLVGLEDSPLAELSLDEVRLEASSSPDDTQAASEPFTRFFEAEVELRPAGTERDLQVLATALQDEWHLEPEPLSKFERAVKVCCVKSPEGVPSEEHEIDAAPADQPTVKKDRAKKTPAAHAKRGQKQGKKGRFLGDGLAVLEKPGLTAADTMAEAANKTILYHLQKMMLHEPGTRDGADPEELHDMRVATRRMRAAVRVFEDYLDMDAFGPYLKLMKQTGRELGAVRDLDVFGMKTQAYVESLPARDQAGLDLLLEAWAKERDRARAEMVTFLDGAHYQHFKERFEHFLRTPGAGAKSRVAADGEPLPSRVRDVFPGVLFERLASVRAFDEWITRDDAPLIRFHQLRITSKGLRYTLEFFQEVLGPECKALIDTTKLVQDHLGDLQDATVTCDVLLGFLSAGTWGSPQRNRKDFRQAAPVNAPGVATYLAAKQDEIVTLMGTFGPVWDQIRGPQFSQPLAALVGAL
jgi:CHAD domain-containing protein